MTNSRFVAVAFVVVLVAVGAIAYRVGRDSPDGTSAERESAAGQMPAPVGTAEALIGAAPFVSVRPGPLPSYDDTVTLVDHEMTVYDRTETVEGAPAGREGRAARYRIVIRNDSPYALEAVLMRLAPSVEGALGSTGFTGDEAGPNIQPGATAEFVRWVVEDPMGIRATLVAVRVTEESATEAAARPDATESVPAWYGEDMAIDPAAPITMAPEAFDGLVADPDGAVHAELQWSVSGEKAHGGGTWLELSAAVPATP